MAGEHPVRQSGARVFARRRLRWGSRRTASTVAAPNAKERLPQLACSPPRNRLPTAVIAFNDRCALGFIDVAIRAGIRVPQDISVVGFDDSPLAGLAHVDLTTVGQDSARLAEIAVARAVARIDTPADGAVDAVSEPRLVVRGSTMRRGTSR